MAIVVSVDGLVARWTEDVLIFGNQGTTFVEDLASECTQSIRLLPKFEFCRKG